MPTHLFFAAFVAVLISGCDIRQAYDTCTNGDALSGQAESCSLPTSCLPAILGQGNLCTASCHQNSDCPSIPQGVECFIPPDAGSGQCFAVCDNSPASPLSCPGSGTCIEAATATDLCVPQPQ